MFTRKEITIIGFGNQAKAWALNLRDSGWKVIIALRDNSPSAKLVKELNFQVVSLPLITTNLCAVLTPDETHSEIVRKYPQETLKLVLYMLMVSLFCIQIY